MNIEHRVEHILYIEYVYNGKIYIYMCVCILFCLSVTFLTRLQNWLNAREKVCREARLNRPTRVSTDERERTREARNREKRKRRGTRGGRETAVSYRARAVEKVRVLLEFEKYVRNQPALLAAPVWSGLQANHVVT